MLRLHAMKDDAQYCDRTDVAFRLKELLKDIPTFIDYTSENQQQTLLKVLEQWLRGGDPRRHPRKDCSMSVTYSAQDQVFTDFITNIAAGGVFIQTSVPLSIGQEIKLRLPFPSQEEPTTIMCQVVWKSPLGFGAQFTGASEQFAPVIEAL